MLKLLIADYDETCRSELAAALGAAYDIRTCRDGAEALEILRHEKPSIMVLDLLLPEIDGISLLQQAAREGVMPMVLATTRFVSDYIAQTLITLGVSYLMTKPCDITAMIARLADLTKHLQAPIYTEADPRSYVAGILLALGIPAKRKGYICIREAVLLMARDANQSITKEIYPAVAKMIGGSAPQVERLIRSAIEKAWDNRDPENWNRYFPDWEVRPTNLELIARLADCLNLRYQPK